MNELSCIPWENTSPRGTQDKGTKNMLLETEGECSDRSM